MNPGPRTVRDELLAVYPNLAGLSGSIDQAFQELVRCFSEGGKVLVCGNGGSAADSEHIVGELMKGFRRTRPLAADRVAAIDSHMPEGIPGPGGQHPVGPESVGRILQQGLAAISLTSHTALISAIGNDQSFEVVFAQQVNALGKPGDVLIGLSTSGNAANVIAAFAVARALGIATIALSGKDGGDLSKMADVPIVVPAGTTPEIQELHLPIYHALCAMVEEQLFGQETQG